MCFAVVPDETVGRAAWVAMVSAFPDRGRLSTDYLPHRRQVRPPSSPILCKGGQLEEGEGRKFSHLIAAKIPARLLDNSKRSSGKPSELGFY